MMRGVMGLQISCIQSANPSNCIPYACSYWDWLIVYKRMPYVFYDIVGKKLIMCDHYFNLQFGVNIVSAATVMRHNAHSK